MEIIENEFINYKERFSNSSSKFITNWPKEGEVKGWYIKMKKGGHLKRHMHEDGWISGTIYLEMPENNNKNDGMMEFSLFCEHYLMDEKKPKGHVRFALKKGDIVLSVLFPRNNPFNSDERRVGIVFDFKPSYI